MSNLITQYIRRIAKLLPDKEVPRISPLGTNHIDDPQEWDDKTIYKGEIAINLNTGKIFSSDGNNVVYLGRNNGILLGMQVMVPKDIAAEPGTNSIPRDLTVTNGYVNINGKKYYHKSVATSSAGDVKIDKNSTIRERFDLIYAIGTNEMSSSQPFKKAEIVSVKGPNNIEYFYEDERFSDFLPSGKTINDCILLAIVRIPSNYGNESWHQLRPWSWSVSMKKEERQLNLLYTQPSPIPNITPAYLIDYLKNHIFEHIETEDYRYKKIYLEGQLLKHGSSLYSVQETHLCRSLLISLQNNLLVEISGSGVGTPGTGGVNIHEDLIGLGFDDSGHMGFQRKTFIENRDPGQYDCDFGEEEPTGGFQAETGSLWWNKTKSVLWLSINDSINNAQWVLLNKIAIRSTELDKNYTPLETNGDNQQTGIKITNTPANESYVKVEINGLGTILGNGTKFNCDCYFSDDGGDTAKQIRDIKGSIGTPEGDELYWNGDFNNYNLSADDKISLYYLVYTVDDIILEDIYSIWGGTSTIKAD